MLHSFNQRPIIHPKLYNRTPTATQFPGSTADLYSVAAHADIDNRTENTFIFWIYKDDTSGSAQNCLRKATTGTDLRMNMRSGIEMRWPFSTGSVDVWSGAFTVANKWYCIAARLWDDGTNYTCDLLVGSETEPMTRTVTSNTNQANSATRTDDSGNPLTIGGAAGFLNSIHGKMSHFQEYGRRLTDRECEYFRLNAPDVSPQCTLNYDLGRDGVGKQVNLMFNGHDATQSGTGQTHQTGIKLPRRNRAIVIPFPAAVAATGRIMSSLTNYGGLAGMGGIAGMGGGLAG